MKKKLKISRNTLYFLVSIILYIPLVFLILKTSQNHEQPKQAVVTEQANTSIDFYTEIMLSPDTYPQLSKDEFLEITEHYLETNEWNLPIEKTCFHTYGIDERAYIIENEFLFRIYFPYESDTTQYEVSLLYYIDGEVKTFETDPAMFDEFLKNPQ